LEDWWKVAAAMMGSTDSEDEPPNASSLWRDLQHIQDTHPAPIHSYATQVGTAYRKRLLLQFPPTLPMAPLLNFSSFQELQDFCQQQGLILPITTNGALGIAKLIPETTIIKSTHHSSPLCGLNASGIVDSKASITQVVTFLETASLTSTIHMMTSGSSNKTSAKPDVA
jgi:hypothetical protein